MIRRVCLLLVAVVVAACGGGDRVIVGAGTTTVDSGFMAALEDQYGRDISIVPGSTAELLELAARGAVDVVVVHDEARELAFMESHPGARRAPAFESDFVLVGPANLVDSLANVSAPQAMAAIAAAGFTFVTRDDGSGTHSRELSLWASAGVEPSGAWYIATGQGMGLTLQVADQLGGFTLVEAGVLATAADTIDLVPILLGNAAGLVNQYSVIGVTQAGGEFFEWLSTAGGAAAIAAANAAILDVPIYRPVTTAP